MVVMGIACWFLWQTATDEAMAESLRRMSRAAAKNQRNRVREIRIPRGENAPHDEKVFSRYEKTDFDACDLEAEFRLGDQINLTFFETLRLGFTITRQMKAKTSHRVYLASSGGRDGAHAVILQKEGGGVVVHVWDDHVKAHFLISCHDHIAWIGELGDETSSVLCMNGNGNPISKEDIDTNEPPPEKLSDGSVVVDVLIAQDTRSVDYAAQLGLAPDEFAELTLQQVNAVLEQSGLLDDFSFRLVHSGTLDGSLGADPEEVLKRVRMGYELNGVSLDRGVRRMREEHGADLVVVLMDSETGFAGISEGLSGIDYLGGIQCVYGVCDMRSAMLGYTMAHELGHLFGAGHSDEQEFQKGPQLFEFSAGCYGDDWCSVMSYPKAGHWRKIGEFSSPKIGDEHHDNVQTIRLTYARISNYRRAKDNSPKPVARRAEKSTSADVAEQTPSTVTSNATIVATALLLETAVAAKDLGKTMTDETPTPTASRRRRGQPTVTLEEFGRLVFASSSGETEGKVVAALPPGAVLNFDTKQMAEEFKANHPNVVEVMTDFLPDGVALEQLSNGEIVPEDENDAQARKSRLLLAADKDGFLVGRFNLIYTDEKGTASVVVRVEGRLMGNGESGGIASIDGDDSGPWYLTIAPDAPAPDTSSAP